MARTLHMNNPQPYATFYNSVNHDRVYDADSMAEWLTPFFCDGVFNGDLQVTANDDMSVSVQPGFGYIDGKLRHFIGVTRLDIELPHSTYDRIDIVVLRRDDTERDFVIDIKTGVADIHPVAPDLVRNDTVWEMQLGEVSVEAGVTRITQADITDTRMLTDKCGYVVATVNEIDFDQIWLQWKTKVDEYSDEYDQWTDETRQDFMDWFNNLKYILDGDVAGHLQNEIEYIMENSGTIFVDAEGYVSIDYTKMRRL